MVLWTYNIDPPPSLILSLKPWRPFGFYGRLAGTCATKWPVKYCFYIVLTFKDSLNLPLYPYFRRTVSEARSYDETTIQAPTKSLRSVYEKQSSHMNNDVSVSYILLNSNVRSYKKKLKILQEANTMAEREVGSTLLMPHTHLYKQVWMKLLIILNC